MVAKFMPWRLRWFFSKCLSKRFWASYFHVTSETPKISAVSTFIRAFLRPIDIDARSKDPIALNLHGGAQIKLTGFTDLFIFTEIFVEKEYDWPDLKLQPKTIVDIGANIGLFALRMTQRHAQAELFCFEPFPPNFSRLEDLVTRNDIQRIKRWQKGVSSTSGHAQLYVHDKNTGGHSIVSELRVEDSRSVEIELIALKRLFDLIERPHIDILKLDCEGAEKDIILSLTPDLAERIHAIVFEPSPHIYSTSLLTDHLNILGYKSETRHGLIFSQRRQAA